MTDLTIMPSQEPHPFQSNLQYFLLSNDVAFAPDPPHYKAIIRLYNLRLNKDKSKEMQRSVSPIRKSIYNHLLYHPKPNNDVLEDRKKKREEDEKTKKENKKNRERQESDERRLKSQEQINKKIFRKIRGSVYEGLVSGRKYQASQETKNRKNRSAKLTSREDSPNLKAKPSEVDSAKFANSNQKANPNEFAPLIGKSCDLQPKNIEKLKKEELISITGHSSLSSSPSHFTHNPSFSPITPEINKLSFSKKEEEIGLKKKLEEIVGKIENKKEMPKKEKKEAPFRGMGGLSTTESIQYYDFILNKAKVLYKKYLNK